MNIAVLFKGLAVLAWAAAIFAVGFIVVQSGRGRPIKKARNIIIGVIIGALVLSTVSAGIVFIRPQERGVVISAIQPAGYRPQALQPGLQWIIPFAESVVVYPISRQTYTMSIASYEGAVTGDDSIEARTADGQKVLVDASVIFTIDPAKIIQVHIEWQDRYTDDLVRPLVRGIIRDEVSQYGVEEVYSSKRLELVEKVNQELAKKLNDNGLILVDFVLRNISFSEEYAASVEQKQIAEQLAQQAAFVVEQRKQEAEQARQVAQGLADAVVIQAQGDADARIIQAEAEAAALLLISQALEQNPDLLTYTYITKLSPNVSVMLVPNDAAFLFPLSNSLTPYTVGPATP